MKDKEIEEYNDRFMKKALRSTLYTFFIFLVTIFGVIYIVDLVFVGGDASFIISFFISTIFTIFYCTLTIIEEIRKIK